MKTCPISNKPIDLMTHRDGVYQITCPSSRWTSSLFSDLDEAIEFRASIDIPKVVLSASREERDGKVRLVGDRWMTMYMLPAELDKIISSLTPVKAKRKAE